jgi:hypothetical protein
MKRQDLKCQKASRREAVRRSKKGLNGLDYLEVDVSQDLQGNPEASLKVYFLGRVPPKIELENIVIEGGSRVKDINVVHLNAIGSTYAEFDDCLIITLDRPGDFSTYTLRLVEEKDGKPTDMPMEGFDPRFSFLDFSFMAECPSDLDCKPPDMIQTRKFEEIEVDYLARDYSGFRQMILDRLSLIIPDWKERHIPDQGIALVEILAYAGDLLSYYQDAVATEAYLDTARRRISVRRHARLVDYKLHEGCNSRAWILLEISPDLPHASQEIHLSDLYFITRPKAGLQAGPGIVSEEDLKDIPFDSYEVFEPLDDAEYKLHEEDIDPDGMAIKLKDPEDELSEHIKRQLSADVRKIIDSYGKAEYSSEKLQAALVEDLNKLIEGYSIYDQNLFPKELLRDETQSLIGQDLRGEDLSHLNRLLLEDAYRQEIERKGSFRIYTDHNCIKLYTWGDRECYLPRGATSATLRDEWESRGCEDAADGEDQSLEKPSPQPLQSKKRILKLRAGDLLLFEEVKGIRTGNVADADPSHRHIVRLTRVTPSIDPVFDQPVVDIEWAKEDALPFAFYICALAKPLSFSERQSGDSEKLPDSALCSLIKDISVVRGNILLADHGRQNEESFDPVQPKSVVPSCMEEGVPGETSIEPEKICPRLQKGPLTFSQPFRSNLPASISLMQDPREALPLIDLHGSREECIDSFEQLGGSKAHGEVSGENERKSRVVLMHWNPVSDLLDSESLDSNFVVEMDNDGFAQLRFGDGELGRMPKVGTRFKAVYRVGNGPAGNIGRDKITNVVFRKMKLCGVEIRPRNPLPAVGGISPEKIEDVKLLAPHAFRKELLRAITAEDYALLAQRHPRVQRASTTIRWTGSWHDVVVAIDPLGSVEADQELLDEVEMLLHKYCRMGYDLSVKAARYVALDIKMTICVKPDYLRGHVEAELLDLLSNRVLRDGKLGFFHPDNLTFGEGIYLSRLVAAAQAVTGVESVFVDKLQRLFEPSNYEIERGLLAMGPLEVARLDNDPNFPENGVLVLNIMGGR